MATSSSSPPGDYGKRRPAVVIQTNLLNDSHASVVVDLITSDLETRRCSG